MMRPEAITARAVLVALAMVGVAAITASAAMAMSDVDEGDGSPGSEGVATRNVQLDAADRDIGGRPLVIDRVDPATVLTINASGFSVDAIGVISQCQERTPCRNRLPVRFDGGGGAIFQYLITDDVSPGGRCRLGAARCTLELEVDETVLVVDTVFVDEAPAPGELTIEPEGGLRVGDSVTAIASGFPSGAELVLSVCAGLDSSGPRCGKPGPTIPVTAGADGSAEATLTVPAEVGADRVACGRRSQCRLVVTSADLGAWARPVPLSFAGAPGADYDLDRLIAGLVAAVGLVAVGIWLWRSTDWRPPPEADASAIDDAEYADLDAEADAFVDPDGSGDEAERIVSSDWISQPSSRRLRWPHRAGGARD
jgi:hypothetical protein